MSNTHTTLSSLFTAIATKIRSKTGESESIIADEFPSKIEGVYNVGYTAGLAENLDTSDATATEADIVNGATAYVNGEKITGTATLAKTKATAYDYEDPYHSGWKVASFNGTILKLAATDSSGDYINIRLS